MAPGEGAGKADGGTETGDSTQIKQMQGRLFGRFPDLKKAYEERLKKDPELATDIGKFRAFLGKMREKGVLPASGGRRGR